MDFQVKEITRNVHHVEIENIGPKWEQWFLLTSDWHFDNPDCNRELLFKHLQQAKERNAGVFCFGDLFCAMQGAKDRRGSKSKVRQEHMTDNYFDSLVNDTYEKLKDYSDVLTLLTYGNHETAIKKHNETDLLDRLVFRLNIDNENKVHRGGYGGYVRFMFRFNGDSVVRQGKVLKYFHGSGGNSPVTKGAIQQQRAAVKFPSADIVVMGHIHQMQTTNFSQEVLDNLGNVTHRNQVHIRTSTYKDEYKDGFGGWGIEKGFAPSPMGGYWLRFFRDGKDIKFDYTPTV